MHAAIALVVMLCSQIPVILWNSHHDWVMFKHIGTQGFGGGAQKSFVQQYLLDPFSRIGAYNVGGRCRRHGGHHENFVLNFAMSVWDRSWERRQDEPAGNGDQGNKKIIWHRMGFSC